MSWCFVSSFCPKEAEMLGNCMEGDLGSVPKKCLKQWKKFDSCLVKLTEEYERNQMIEKSTQTE